MTTKEAVVHLVSELKKDEGYYMSWQANIAMQFKDECKRQGVTLPGIHEISNNAAKNFIDLLCYDVELKEDKPKEN
jgi:hypothetical protein